jgi:hypothetical protein
MYTDFLQTLDLALKANPDKDPQKVAEGLYNEIKMKLGCDRLWVRFRGLIKYTKLIPMPFIKEYYYRWCTNES